MKDTIALQVTCNTGRTWITNHWTSLEQAITFYGGFCDTEEHPNGTETKHLIIGISKV